jgi:two-component system, OmpR family, sensor histidine kinase KdpD
MFNRSNKELRSALLDALSHEIKTPMTAIKASATTLLSETSNPDAIELLTVINEEVDRLSRFLSETVEIAEMEFLGIPWKIHHCDLAETLNSLIAELSNGMSENWIRQDIPAGLPPLSIDPRLLRLALKQLLENSLKYSMPKTPIVISAQKHFGKIILFVKDVCHGIAEEKQSRIFEKKSGTGIGLSIAKRIISANGGKVDWTNHSGAGCVFRILLPACKGVV